MKLPEPCTLQGWGVRLTPLVQSHAQALFEAATPETFKWYSRFPDPFERAWFDQYVAERTAKGSIGLVIEVAGQVIGSTTFFDFRPDVSALEIGYTWIKDEFRGTFVNPAIKVLMIGHAVEEWGVNRIQLKTDLLNTRSQAAMAKMGATREGVLRQFRLIQGGRLRDEVYFSILASEWPELKHKFEARLTLLGATK